MFRHPSSIAFVSLLCVPACAPGPDDELDELEPQRPYPAVTAYTAERPASAATFNQHKATCQGDPRVIANVVALDVCIGADLFFRETFDGNGRSCASCHPVVNNFTIDPPFIATLPDDDALFVAEFDDDLANLERPEQMRDRGLILENADGFAPDPNVHFVMRGVPHNFSMGVSVTRGPGDNVVPPQDRTGWSGDGAPNQGQLRDFQTGAIVQHYTQSLDRVTGVDFRLATNQELDTIDLFMRRLGRTNDLWLPGAHMNDAAAESGRVTFLSAAARCNACHGNAGANATVAGGGNRNFNTGVETARNVALAGFPIDGGFGGAANSDGSFGNRAFNTPPLIEAADTGPFFHTDTTISGASAHNAETATTIEEAVAFYDSPAFNNSPAGAAGQIDLTATQIDDIGRFLRVINAAFNAQLAVKRLDGALELVNHFQNGHVQIQRTLLEMAMVEVDDALEVLSAVSGLNASSQTQFDQARPFIQTAIDTGSHVTRQSNISQARNKMWSGFVGLGSGIDMIIADGTNMF